MVVAGLLTAYGITSAIVTDIESAMLKIIETTKSIVDKSSKVSDEVKSKLHNIYNEFENVYSNTKSITTVAKIEYNTLDETINGINNVANKIVTVIDTLEVTYQSLEVLPNLPEDELSIIKEQFQFIQEAPKSIKETMSTVYAKNRNIAFPDNPTNFKGEEKIHFCDECYKHSFLIRDYSPKKLKFKCTYCNEMFYIEDGYLSTDKKFYCEMCINKKENMFTFYNINYKQIIDYRSCKHNIYRHLVFLNNKDKINKDAKTVEMKNELINLKYELEAKEKIKSDRDFEKLITSVSKESLGKIGYYEGDDNFDRINDIRKKLKNSSSDKRDFLKKIFDGLFITECINIPKNFRFKFNIIEIDLYMILFDKYYYNEHNKVISKMLEHTSGSNRPYGYFKALYDNFYVDDILTGSNYCNEMSKILKSTIEIILEWFKRGIKNNGLIHTEEEFKNFKMDLYFRTDYFYITNNIDTDCTDVKIIANNTIFRNRLLHNISFQPISEEKQRTDFRNKLNEAKKKNLSEINNWLKKINLFLSDTAKNLDIEASNLDGIDSKDYIFSSPIFYCIVIDFFLVLHMKLEDIKSKLRKIDIWEDDTYVVEPNEIISESDVEQFAFKILITDIRKKDKMLFNYIINKDVRKTYLDTEISELYEHLIGEDVNYIAFRETEQDLYTNLFKELAENNLYSIPCKLIYFILCGKLLINATSEKYGSWKTDDFSLIPWHSL